MNDKNWKTFETFFKINVISITASSDPNNKEPVLILNKKGKQVFLGDGNEQDLVDALSLFLVSLSDKLKPTPSGNVHVLPDICKKVSGVDTLKGWDEMFTRNTQRFGKKENNKEIDANTWTLMKNIYEFWKFSIENAETLSNLSDELSELYNRTISEERALNLRKREPQIKEKLRVWLNEYEKTAKRIKTERYQEYKEYSRIYDVLKTLPETDYTTITPQKGFFDNMSDWGVGKIALVFGSGLILLFLAGWVIKKLYNIN